MTKKEEVLAKMLKGELRSIKRLLKEQDEQIKDIKENGFDKKIHKGYRDLIWTGHHYTQGYCTAHIYLTKKFIGLLGLKGVKGVLGLIKENEEIEAQNKKHLNEVFSEIRSKLKAKKK